jgi:hypothetical protein
VNAALATPKTRLACVNAATETEFAPAPVLNARELAAFALSKAAAAAGLSMVIFAPFPY